MLYASPRDRLVDAGPRSFLLPELLAVATVMSTATKVRYPGVPLGFGELLLVTWLAVSISFRWMHSGFHWPAGFSLRWGGLLLLGTLAALMSGALLAQSTGATRTYFTAYEAVAWVFILGLAAWFAAEAGSSQAVVRYLQTFAAVGSIAASVIIVAAVITRLAFGSQVFWYMGLRMSGWSENPNQFAALLAPLPFLAWYFRSHAIRRGVRRAWSLAITGTVVAGVATQSDALWLGWLLGTSALLVIAWARGLFGSTRTVKSILVSSVVVPSVIASLLVPISGMLVQSMGSAVEDRANQGGQADTRITLWQNGVDAVMHSPAFGWGPGAHSGFHGAFEGTESHNSYIDLAAQAGLPVSIGLIILTGVAMYMGFRHRAAPIAVGLLAVVVLAVFHNLLRQPVFWLLLIAVLSFRRVEDAPQSVADRSVGVVNQ